MIMNHTPIRFFAIGLGMLLAAAPAMPALHAGSPEPIPVILDTDIGDDIDDTWALGLLLKCPELDVKLVVGDKGKPLYRAKLIAKFLERANRTDIPVGMALDTDASGGGRQSEWVEDYNLNRYPGRVYPDGVQAMIDLIMASKETVTVIAIGPLPNLREALHREPRIAGKARFVGMHGSVRKGYGNSDKPSAEYNVRADVPACQAALSAGWPIVITPLDTCGLVHLTGPDYAAVRQSKDPICVAIMENYAAWLEPANKARAKSESSTLFDTVAVYLAFADELTRMEELPIRVTDDGHTVIDPTARRMQVATSWKDLDAFERWLAERLAP
jgi:inosine-uridine nucleoside N-ribohydrolase